jgi:DNA-binding response OmpR family regulator
MKKRILVIDDDPQIRKILREALEWAEYEVIEAANGKTGTKLFREMSPDLIITDLVMPEKEGIETIIEIRRHSPDAKIIAISGGGRIGPEGYLNLALNLGAQRAFEKPFRLKDVLEAIQELIGTSPDKEG